MWSAANLSIFSFAFLSVILQTRGFRPKARACRGPGTEVFGSTSFKSGRSRFLRRACALRLASPSSDFEGGIDVTISSGTPRILRRVNTHFPERNAGPRGAGVVLSSIFKNAGCDTRKGSHAFGSHTHGDGESPPLSNGVLKTEFRRPAVQIRRLSFPALCLLLLGP